MDLQVPAPENPVLTFSPLAWLKLQFFCHAGLTEIGGFGFSSEKDFLHVEDFLTVRQQVTAVTVRFQDDAVADLFDSCVDRGLRPERFARIWIHTHPMDSPSPSRTDEETFKRSFGSCDWAVMFIVGRTGLTYARLAFSAGPRGQLLLPVRVDWSAWPRAATDERATLAAHVNLWQHEYQANIEVLPDALACWTAEDLAWERIWQEQEARVADLEELYSLGKEDDRKHDFIY